MHLANVYLYLMFTSKRILNKLSSSKKIVEKEDVVALINRLSPIHTDVPLIRMGPDGDGGYVVPDDYEGIKVCFSPGVGAYSGFEKDLADKGIKVYMADASVEKPLIEHENFHFIKKFIGPKTSGNVITMEDWTREEFLKNDDDMILQMDIEGHEYDALLSMSPELISRFRVIILELHWLYRFWDPAFYDMVNTVFGKLLKDHHCVHVHPNNCCGIFKFNGVAIPRAGEFSFIRKDRVKETSYAKVFPHALDQDNTPLGHIKLPENWVGA